MFCFVNGKFFNDHLEALYFESNTTAFQINMAVDKIYREGHLMFLTNQFTYFILNK